MTTNKLVLLIDDDPPTTRVMRLILEPEGYALNVVSDREEALMSLTDQRPAVVIMDYLMAGLGPAEFIEQARGSGFDGPILLCTALHQDLGLAVDDVLLKPFYPDELTKRLAALLSDSQEPA
jgi:CheY-like chemotaxis protein